MMTHRTQIARTSRHVPEALAVALCLTATAACERTSSQGAQSAADHAAFMERTRCAADDDDKTIAPVLSASAVQSVEPLYSAVGGAKSGPQSELRGVTITVSALPGVTAEWLDRALECHSARGALGHTATASDDPFWLPGSTVDIDVRSAKDGFDVAIGAYSSGDARRVLDRANSFAKAKAPAPSKANGQP